MKNLLLSFLLLCSGKAVADNIITNKGLIYIGTITGATRESVLIFTEDGNIEINKSTVSNIIFTNSDLIHLNTGAVIKCKIVNKIGNDIIIVTVNGEEIIPTSLIKIKFYNKGASLEVQMIPETGVLFKNDSNINILTEKFKRIITTRLYTGSLHTSLNKGNKAFVVQSASSEINLVVPTILENGSLIGVILDATLTEFNRVGIGYEEFKTEKSSGTGISSALPIPIQAKYKFVYGRISQYQHIWRLPTTTIYGSVDLGLLYVNEEFNIIGGRETNLTGSTIGIRYMLGLNKYFYRYLYTSIEFGYLSAKASKLDLFGTEFNDAELDFSGYSFNVSFGSSVSFFNIIY